MEDQPLCPKEVGHYVKNQENALAPTVRSDRNPPAIWNTVVSFTVTIIRGLNLTSVDAVEVCNLVGSTPLGDIQQHVRIYLPRRVRMKHFPDSYMPQQPIESQRLAKAFVVRRAHKSE